MSIKSNWFVISLSFIALFCAVIATCCFVSDNVVINDQSIVLVFIGILATFIVVGNYAQADNIKNDIKKEYDEQIKILKQEIEKMNKRHEEIEQKQFDFDGSRIFADKLISVINTETEVTAIGFDDGTVKNKVTPYTLKFKVQRIWYNRENTCFLEVKMNNQQSSFVLQHFTAISINDLSTTNILGVEHWLTKEMKNRNVKYL